VEVFSCPTVCGSSCCYFERELEGPVVTESERRTLERLASRRGLKLEFTPIEVRGRTFYRWVIHGHCPFLTGHLCGIYEKRPLACRMFPLVLNVNTGEVYLSEYCVWVKERLSRGERLTLEQFPEELKALSLVLKIVYG